MKIFNVSINGNCQITEKEVWPDGGGPENPTAEDVAKEMKEQSSSLHSLISEWNMDDCLEITVMEAITGPLIKKQIADLDNRMRIRVR
jgi:hypothetical protein